MKKFYIVATALGLFLGVFFFAIGTLDAENVPTEEMLKCAPIINVDLYPPLLFEPKDPNDEGSEPLRGHWPWPSEPKWPNPWSDPFSIDIEP